MPIKTSAAVVLAVSSALGGICCAVCVCSESSVYGTSENLNKARCAKAACVRQALKRHGQNMNSVRQSLFSTQRARRGHHAPPPAPWSDAAILCCSLHYSYFEPPRITLGPPSKGAAITWTEAWQKQRLWAKNGSKRRVAKFLTRPKDTDGSCVPRRITDAVGQRA